MASRRLIIFVKAPRPGSVKTRLAAELGHEAATEAYRRMVETLVNNLKDVSDVELRFCPDDAEREIAQWSQPGWITTPQGQGDLGARLANAFNEAFNSGCDKVIAIGSDCPDVDARDIQDAWASLASNDVVLGPATDGGYWLIALRSATPQLFAGIDWSTEQTLEQTLDAASKSSLDVKLLRRLTDIDTPEDWRQFSHRPPSRAASGTQ